MSQLIFCNGESGRVNFCPGELIEELLARIREWHQNLSEKTDVAFSLSSHVETEKRKMPVKTKLSTWLHLHVNMASNHARDLLFFFNIPYFCILNTLRGSRSVRNHSK